MGSIFSCHVEEFSFLYFSSSEGQQVSGENAHIYTELQPLTITSQPNATSELQEIENGNYYSNLSALE